MSTHFNQFKDEIDQLNLIYSAYVSEINNPEKLLDLGFTIVIEPYIENKTPDFIFVKDDYALIIEAKGGSVSETDFSTVENYLNFDAKALEKVMAEFKIKKPIYRYDVGIVYYNKKLRESLQYEDIKNKIEDLSNEALILTISSGGYLKLYSGKAKDTDTHKLLETGIKVPKNPKRVVNVTSSSPVEGIIYKIILDVGNRMELKKAITMDESLIFNEMFKNYRIKFHRVKEALTALKTLKIIMKKDRKYEFSRKGISDGMELIRKFKSHNIDELIKEKGQKSLDDTY